MKNRPYRIITDPQSIQGSPEWLEFRKGKISATLLSSIMGVGYLTPLQAFEEIIFDKPREQSSSMARGSLMEDKARCWANEKYGVNYQPVVVQSIDNPLFIASLDGYYEDEDGEPHILEIKCDNAIDHALALNGTIPDKHIPQTQGQMHIVGVEDMRYISYKSDDDVAVVHSTYDPEYCVMLYREAIQFHESLIEMKPPKPTDKDWVEEKDISLINLVEVYNCACERYDEAKEAKDQFKAEIIEEMMHPRVKIGKTKIQMITKKGEVDYTKLIADLGIEVDLEKYRKPSSQFWKISY